MRIIYKNNENKIQKQNQQINIQQTAITQNKTTTTTQQKYY